MAIGEFYDIPEIHLGSATPDQFAECIKWRRSTEKKDWVSEKLDLARLRPEELPPCFLAVKRESISFREGWETEHGWWEPKESYANQGFRDYYWEALKSFLALPDSTPRLPPSKSMWIRTTLVFRPKEGGRKCDMVLMLYNTLIENSTMEEHSALVEEDISICCVFPAPEENGKGAVRIEAPSWQLPTPPARTSVYAHVSNSKMDALRNKLLPAGWTLNTIDPDGGGPPKRRKLNPNPVGGSSAWLSFIKIYTNDSKETKVWHAACLHCGRLMSVKDGSTKSLLTHNKSCQCKPGSSVDTPQ